MKKKLIILSLFAVVSTTYAQEKQDSIKKEDVVVEFSFNPTLSHVFKLKTLPNEVNSFSKKAVSYQINSKGVPSDFVPIPKKVVYINIDASKPQNYNNYIYGAAGLYGNGEFELLLQPQKIRKDYEYGLSLTSYNAQNGIKNKKVDNGQWKINLGLFFAKKGKKYDWRTDVNYQNNQVHWYGLDNNISAARYQNKNVKQTYKNLNLSGIIAYKNAFVKTLTPSLQFFSDAFKSSEINLKLGTAINPSFLGDVFKTKVDFQYLNGSFNQGYGSTKSINYNFLNVGITPSYVYVNDAFKITTGLGLFLNHDGKASKTNFLVLPKVQVDIVLLKDIMNLHGGVRSQLNQNSYASLATKNPFVSPTLNIKTSHTPADFFLGLDGALSNTIRYGVEGSYKTIKNQALYVHNSSLITENRFFGMGNSFRVVYDELKIISVKANAEIDLSKELKLGGKVTVNSYNPKNQQKAWNMSGITMETYANLHHNKWFSQLGVNFVDGRYSLVQNQAKKLNGFLDVNFKAGYEITERFNVHLNLYNMLNNNYQLYKNYRVQGFQAVAGLSYKF